MVFKGQIRVDEKEDEEEKKVTYRFTLSPEDQTIVGTLNRNVTVTTTYTPKTDKGQTIADTVIDRYTETISIGEDNFRLEDIQFSQTDRIDNRPAANFYSGEIYGRKYYTINGNEGTAYIDITGEDVGYKNFWGNTETQIIKYTYTVNRIGGEEGEEANSLSWTGTVQVQASDSNTKSLRYSENGANFTSFNGGYISTINREMVQDIPLIFQEKLVKV